MQGLAISAVQGVQTTQDVATFSDTDSTAVPVRLHGHHHLARRRFERRDHHRGRVQRLPRHRHAYLYHVGRLGQAITVTIKDPNGTLYKTGAFNQTNLVSSVAGMAAVTDASLINPWGMSSSATSPIWVSDQGSGVSTLYNPNGSPIKQGLTVTIPASGPPSGPTGQVFNNDATATDFTIPGPGGTRFPPSSFSPLSAERSSAGTPAPPADDHCTDGDNRHRRRLHRTGPGERHQRATTTLSILYAADFTGTTGASGIDVFDPSFTNVSGTTFAGKFVDPNAVAGFTPYNVAFLNGNLYVAYVQPSGIVTTGGGYIDEFDTAGNFINRIFTDTAGTNLKGPWGMAIAPAGFGSFGGDLLVGNFGDATGTAPNGTIIAITLPGTPGSPGTLAGTLSTPNGTLTNPGIWGLLFGNGGSGGSTGTLYFTAGIDAQTQGLFGGIAFASGASVIRRRRALDCPGRDNHGFEGNPLATAPGRCAGRDLHGHRHAGHGGVVFRHDRLG